MAPDLLSTICREIDERLGELRPLLAEREQLLVAADALVEMDGEGGPAAAAKRVAPVKRARRSAQARLRRRGSAAGAIERAAASKAEAVVEEPVTEEPAKSSDTTKARRGAKAPEAATKSKPERAARGAAREAILAALDHGSHTVGELSVVTAMSGPNINGNLRRLFSEGAVVKTEREGKAAWALAETVS